MKKIFCLMAGLFVFIGVAFSQNSTSADEILKWKQLYDAGAITEEEYNAQKAKVLQGKSTGASQSNESGASMETVLVIEKLLDDDMVANKDKIIELSKELSFAQKMRLYDKYEKGAGGYFALNLLLGFGIGSFAQGNKSAGWAQLGLWAAGFGLVYNGVDNENSSTVTIGALFIIGSTVVGCVTPWVYSSNHNAALKESLGMTDGSISFAPIINPVNEQYGLMARIAL